MREIYLNRADEAEQRAKVNTGFTWFYAAMVLVNCGLGIWQLTREMPPISLIVAAAMCVIVWLNVATVRRFKRVARDYRSLAEVSSY